MLKRLLSPLFRNRARRLYASARAEFESALKRQDTRRMSRAYAAYVAAQSERLKWGC